MGWVKIYIFLRSLSEDCFGYTTNMSAFAFAAPNTYIQAVLGKTAMDVLNSGHRNMRVTCGYQYKSARIYGICQVSILKNTEKLSYAAPSHSDELHAFAIGVSL